MRKIAICFLILSGLITGCEKDNIKRDLENINGLTQIRRCFCTPEAWRYLIVVYSNTDTFYYNPVNLSDDFKDKDYKIVFSADLLNDSTIVYANLANDAVVEDFKVRNIKLTKIRK